MNINDDKFWEKINKVSKDDILSMVMDYSNERINSSELMDRINSRCLHVFAQLDNENMKEINLLNQRIGNLEDYLSLIYQHSSDKWVTDKANEALNGKS